MEVGLQRFDLYDFFSILLPGLAFISGLYPFFPMTANTDTLIVALAFVISGFVIGRVLHVVAVSVENVLGVSSPRDYFSEELRGEGTLNLQTIQRFYTELESTFGDIPISGDDDADTNSIYVFVRGFVHIDARGRSRTFQAICAFFRSLQYGAIFLALVYTFYGFIAYTEELGLYDYSSVSYTPKIVDLGIMPSVVASAAIILSTVVYWISKTGKYKFADHYATYLVIDFIIASSDNQ